MMQEDEDIGKMGQAVPVMVARALELFSTMLVQQAGEVAKERGAKTLTQEHVVTAVKDDSRLDFLLHLVEGMGGGKKEKKKGHDDFLKDRKLPEKDKLTSATENPEVKKINPPKVPFKTKDPASSKRVVSPDLTQGLSFTKQSAQFSLHPHPPVQNMCVVSRGPGGQQSQGSGVQHQQGLGGQVQQKKSWREALRIFGQFNEYFR